MKIVTKIYDREGYVKTYKDMFPEIFETTTDLLYTEKPEIQMNFINSEIQKIEIEFKHDE